MLFETKRLTIRNWQDTDKPHFAKMGQDPEVMKYLGGLRDTAACDQAADDQMALYAKDEPAFWAAELRSSGEFMGFIGVKAINFDAPFAAPNPGYEIGWRLARHFWGQGYATEGAKAALAFAFANWDMDQIWSFTVPENRASQKVMQKIGMFKVVEGDFAHPSLDKDDPLSLHVLYRAERYK